MTVVARRIASVPTRLATSTWERVVELIAPRNEAAQRELASVLGVASSLITREAMKDSPVIVSGKGPRLRLYCVYGDDAITGENVNEAAIPESPAETDTWAVSLPCPSDDLSWIRHALKAQSSRITARDQSEKGLPEDEPTESAATTASINIEEFLRT